MPRQSVCDVVISDRTGYSCSVTQIDLGGGAELRLLGEADADSLFALTDENRAYLRQWLPWLDGTRSVDDTRAFLEEIQKAQAAGRAEHYGLWQEGRLVGTIGIGISDRKPGSAEIGYWLSEGEQGHGLMTRATRALVDYAFDRLGLTRLEIHCALGNERSRAIPERLGFRQEQVLERAEWLYDHFVDLAVYVMDVQSWRWTAGSA